ncbi:hypothetical protein LTS12_016502 [Elasticomyces elasticus]|nr:hypothetical protein LTS12_016502 [Elasticomyces elasticus]
MVTGSGTIYDTSGAYDSTVTQAADTPVYPHTWYVPRTWIYPHYYWSWDAQSSTSVVTWAVTTIDTTYTISATDLADESEAVSEINASLSALSVEATSLYAVLTASSANLAGTGASASATLIESTAVSSTTTTGAATTTTTTQSVPQLGASGSGSVATTATLMLIPFLVALVWL